jgi:predicted phage-related endonuclease
MANDRSDFEPEVRNSAWWASDSRQAVNGKAIEVILQKQGKMERPDLSGIEAVQMGHVMQPIIGQLAQEKLGMELKDADYMLSHPNHPWLRSHFDFISADGRTLVEAKNYNAGARNKFDDDSLRIPAPDYVQLIHEAAVHNVDKAVLAVLFGGQEFVTFEFDITAEMKDDLIKQMAVFWGHVNAQTLPEPETVEQTKLVYPVDNGLQMLANQQMEQGVVALKEIKDIVKQYEDKADQIEARLRALMGDNSEMVTVDGRTLISWKNSKPSKRFSADLLKSAMPDIYEKFIVEQPGSRRFLVK